MEHKLLCWVMEKLKNMNKLIYSLLLFVLAGVEAFGQTKSLVVTNTLVSTNLNVPKFSGTSGTLITNSAVVISDANAITAGDGTQSLPTFSFLNDPNTGIFSSAANSIGFTTDGTERWSINSSGALNPILDDTYDIGNSIVNPRDIHFSDQLVGMQGTITASAPILDLSSTWNNGAVTFTGLKYNVTDTASAAASLLMDLQVGSDSKFGINKGGLIQIDINNNPMVSATTATNTGFYIRTTENLGFTIGGSYVMEWDNFSSRREIRASKDYSIGWSSNASALAAVSDLLLIRDAAATLQMGADAATATAQKLKAHDGSGTDKTGADMTIAAGIGTGTATGGSLYLQTGGVGASTGSSLNTLTNRVTITPTGQTLFSNGTNSAPSISFINDSDSGFYWDGSKTVLAANGVNIVQFWSASASLYLLSNTAQFSLGASADVSFVRDAAATWQSGVDAAAPVAQTFKAHDGSGTDIAGASLSLKGGQSTGTGAGGALITQTSLSGSTGSSANSYSTRTYQNAKPVTLTESAATTIATIAVGSSKYVGAKLFVTVNAADATDFQAISSTLNVNAVNKAGTVTSTITQVDGTTAPSAGTLSATYTVTTSGANVIVQCNAVSSLTQTTLAAKWSIETLNSDDTAAITVP